MPYDDKSPGGGPGGAGAHLDENDDFGKCSLQKLQFDPESPF